MAFLNTIKSHGRSIELNEAEQNCPHISNITNQEVFHYFHQYSINAGAEAYYSDGIKSIIYWAEQLIKVVNLLQGFHSGKVKCTGLSIPIDVYYEWHNASDSILISYLEDFWSNETQEYLRSEFTDDVLSILTRMPSTQDITITTGEFIQEDTLGSIRERVIKIQKDLKGLIKKRNEHAVREFLYFLRERGLSFCNEIDREIYDVLDFYGYIPEEVKHGHNTQCTSTDPFSNYISSFRKKCWKE